MYDGMRCYVKAAFGLVRGNNSRRTFELRRKITAFDWPRIMSHLGAFEHSCSTHLCSTTCSGCRFLIGFQYVCSGLVFLWMTTWGFCCFPHISYTDKKHTHHSHILLVLLPCNSRWNKNSFFIFFCHLTYFLWSSVYLQRPLLASVVRILLTHLFWMSRSVCSFFDRQRVFSLFSGYLIDSRL